MAYKVEGFEIDPGLAQLCAAGRPIPLRHKTFQLLLYLLRNRDRVVGRDELLREIWLGAAVSENSVAQCIIELRKALGDDAREPRFIRTCGREGYRFIGPAKEFFGSAVAALVPATISASTRRVFPRWAWGALASVGIVLVWFGVQANRASAPQIAATAIAMTSSLNAARAYLSGVEMARQYHAAEAIVQFEKALQLDPNFIMARARIGYVYSVRWLWEEKGRPYLESAYSSRDRLNELHRLYILAWYDLAHRDYDSAIRDLRQLLSRFPAENEAREELGRILLGEERFDEARTELERAVRSDPSAAQAHNFLSALYMATHDFPRALAEARQFVKLQPAEVNAHDTLAMAYEAANDFEQAERTYRWILERQPRFGSRIHLANTLYKLGRWREAKQELRQYIADAPSDSERHWGNDQLAVIALQEGNIEEVRGYARSQPPTGYHDQEILLAIRRGVLTEADRLLSSRPEHADRGQRANARLFLYLQGERALASHDETRAIEAFRQAVAQRTPLYAVEWHEDCLADAYLRLGRLDDAIVEYRRVLAIYPRLALTWHGLAEAYAAKGRQDLSREAQEKALETWKRADADVRKLAVDSGVRRERSLVAGK